jgi:pre-mRNA-processing factor 19
MDGQIKVYDVKSGANAANFDEQGPIQALAFSENGIWLAAVCQGSTNISIWDLRKSEQINVLTAGSEIERIRWDYTGQFLAIASRSGLAVQQYSKSTKEWTEPLRNATPALAVEWGAKAHQLVSLGLDGTLTILGSE